MKRRICRRLFVVLGAWRLLAGQDAYAQALGAFRWQQQPHCNVITLNVVRAGAVFHLDGFDDQCGAATRAAVSGLAFLNPNGSVGMGLTIVTAPGGAPTHLDVSLSLSTISGTWRDPAGASGPWTFQPGPSSGGAPRPALRPVFTQGLSAGGAAVGNVGLPSAATDATNKAYVDNADASILAFARNAALAAIPVSAYSSVPVGGESGQVFTHGCRELSNLDGGLRLDLPIPTGASIAGIRVKYTSPGPAALTFVVRQVEFPGAGETIALTFPSQAGTVVETRAVTGSLVSATRTYYLNAQANTTSEGLFCGAEVLFTRP